MQLKIEIYGDPAPQGSKKIVRGRMIESSKKLKPWRKAIALAVENALPLDHVKIMSACSVQVDFYLPRPPSIKRNKRERPIVPPDVDKLSRGLLDGLGQGMNGVSGDGRLWHDDAIAVEVTARKFYDDERLIGATVVITVL